MEQDTNDEITLKELILKIIEFKNEVLKNWYWVLLYSLLTAGYMYYKASNTPMQYKAELTFMVSDDEGSGLSGMAGILGQFGLGGGSSSKSNPEKMLELLMTRKITERALFHTVSVNGKEDYLANHMIVNLEENKKWTFKPWYMRWQGEPSKLVDFRFKIDSIPAFTRLDNAALKKLHSYIVGSKRKLSVSVSEMTGIMKLKIQMTEEELSIHILNNLYQELSDYYFTKTVEKTETNYKLIKLKTDSLFELLSSKEYQLANFIDSNKGLINRLQQLKQSRLQRDIQKLSIMYGEASKNQEIAEFSYNLTKPYIQEIDIPIVPLKTVKESKTKRFILGLILGGFILSLFIIFRKIIKDVMI